MILEKIEHGNKFISDLHNREVMVYRYVTLNFKSPFKIPQFYFGDFAQEDNEQQVTHSFSILIG